MDTAEFLSTFEAQLNTLENDPGRFHQSLAQASYSTWEDGPFGSAGTGEDQSISIYNKGAIVGMLLDLEIRHATENQKSLDDVMRKLYNEYYKGKKRGFTDAEFQHVCAQVAGASLSKLFTYVYTTKEIDYAPYVSHAGMGIERIYKVEDTQAQMLKLYHLPHPTKLQSAIWQSWSGE
jgi:predicted metalloprotease with PDZ domain